MAAAAYPVQDLAHLYTRRKASNHKDPPDELAPGMDPNGVLGSHEADEKCAEGKEDDEGDAHGDAVRFGEGRDLGEVGEDDVGIHGGRTGWAWGGNVSSGSLRLEGCCLFGNDALETVTRF